MPGITTKNSSIAAANAAALKAQATGQTGRGGSTVSVTQATADAAKSEAPPKASSAPTTKTDYTGLCAFMNANEQNMVGKDTEIPNHYSVVFNPASLGSSTIKLPGGIDKSATANPTAKTAKEEILPETNSMDTNAFSKSITAGTQIIQFIEMVMRNSSYITDQQTQIIDQVTANAKPTTSTSKNNTTTWFKINVTATPVGTKLDKQRQDYAYDIVYTVTPYAINQADSQFFPQAKYRGCHKVYDYWFTGNNTQVLQFEQEYNNLYYNVIDGKAVSNFGQNSNLSKQVAASQLGLAQWPYSKVPTTASGQSSQGAKNGANNPASTLADYLYSSDDQASISLKIIGDPSWIQQGEVVGLNPFNINFNGFYPDGTINTDTQQAVFVINWNAPADYNVTTGLMEINKAGTGGSNNNLASTQPRQSAAYVATKVKSYFNQGRFEQELNGVLLTNLNSEQLQQAADSARPAKPAAETTAAGSREATLDSSGNVTKESELDPNRWGSEESTPGTATDSNPAITNAPTQAAAPAKEPTTYTGSGVPQGPVQPVPLTADMANQLSFNPLKNLFNSTSQRTLAAQKSTSTQQIAAGDDATGK